MITAKFKCDFCGFEEEVKVVSGNAYLHSEVAKKSKNIFEFAFYFIHNRLHRLKDSQWEIDTQYGDMCPKCSKRIPEEIFQAQAKKLEELKKGSKK